MRFEIGINLDIEEYRAAYNCQRGNAKRRGIDFRLTFQEWTNFWGVDIERRGNGQCNLQMQRVADVGAYELSNIRKGTPKQNSATAMAVRANKSSDAAAVELQIAIDAMMNEPSPPPHDIELDDDTKELYKLGMRSSKQLFSHRFFG